MSSTDLQVLRLYKLVGRLERQVAFLFDHLGLEHQGEPSATVPPGILELVRRGDRRKAIRQQPANLQERVPERRTGAQAVPVTCSL